jgi:hypothetical protein
MIPFKIEQLPKNLRQDVEEFLANNPGSAAAQLRPQLAAMRDFWLAFVGAELLEGNTGLGLTPREALEDFNRHFLEPFISRNGHSG